MLFNYLFRNVNSTRYITNTPTMLYAAHKVEFSFAGLNKAKGLGGGGRPGRWQSAPSFMNFLDLPLSFARDARYLISLKLFLFNTFIFFQYRWSGCPLIWYAKQYLFSLITIKQHHIHVTPTGKVCSEQKLANICVYT